MAPACRVHRFGGPVLTHTFQKLPLARLDHSVPGWPRPLYVWSADDEANSPRRRYSGKVLTKGRRPTTDADDSWMRGRFIE